MATQLALYQEALSTHLGERELTSLTENREPRRVLDGVWSRGAVKACLEQSQWKFAQRTSKIVYDASVTPAFGYNRAHLKPPDFVRTIKMCDDEYLNNPLLAYSEETGWWFSSLDDIYVSYVSNDASFGGDLAAWPESFTRYVAGYIAVHALMRLRQNKTDKVALVKTVEGLLLEAKSMSALEGPTVFPPTGSWVSARRGQSATGRHSRSVVVE